jgi:hypothetical protein
MIASRTNGFFDALLRVKSGTHVVFAYEDTQCADFTFTLADPIGFILHFGHVIGGGQNRKTQ